MDAERNKAVVRQALTEIWSEGNFAAADELYAPDFVSHQHGHPAGPRDVRGVDALKTFAAEFRAAFPDFHDTVEDQIAEGDKVATRFTSAGTQTGPLMGIAPTHRHVEWEGISID
jgi:predicted ester cyclase